MKRTTKYAPHSLYRCFSATGELLYIGFSVNVPARLQQHKCKSAWWSEVADVGVERVEGVRNEAHGMEARAIATERPLHNKHHVKSPLTFAEADRLAAEDDSTFARAFRATLAADPAERRIDFEVAS